MKQQKNINERFLRQIWQKKLFNQGDLKTLDGSSLKIILTGIPNNDGGPDFKRAKLKIGEEVYEGDIEIHRNISDWLTHSHSGNPKYNNTILHVVLYNQASFIPTFTHGGRKIPVFILENYLDKPLADIWEEAINEEREEKNRTIPCFDKNSEIPLETKYIWLERLGYRKLEARIKHLEDRLNSIINAANPPKSENGRSNNFEKRKERKYWEQLFYEGIMDGMGYSKNREPFIKLAQNLDIEFLKQKINTFKQDALVQIQAYLFGVAGLIPPINELNDEETITYVNTLNAYWDEFSKDYDRAKINKNDWQFFRLRPQNFPTLRLAGVSYIIPLILQGLLFKNLMNIIKQSDGKLENAVEKMAEQFSVESTGYWTTHFNFTDETRKESKVLIGQGRIDDIIINSLIPIVILYARSSKDFRTEKTAMSLYHFYPRLTDNETSRVIVRQLLNENPIKSAKQQQGAIHLYKYYCLEKKCSKCDIGKALKMGKPEKPEEKKNCRKHN